MYFVIFAYTLRPSISPFSNTNKSLSKRITSATSLAISTAVSTEIPTSATFRDGASLIPSPIYPTLCPFAFNNRIIRAFCSGDSFAKIVVFSASIAKVASSISSISVPNKI